MFGASENQSKIDINRIDYEWVNKTSSVKELHEAYKCLEDDGGYFPELSDHVGKKLASLDPSFAHRFNRPEVTAAEQAAVDGELNDFFENFKKIDRSLQQDGKENIFNQGEKEVAKRLEAQRLAENERLKGNEAVKAKAYSEAVQSYTRSLELDADQPFTHANRAMAYLKQKLYKKALEDANTAIKLKPDYLKAYHRRGKAHAALENYEAAIKDFQFLLEKEPDNKEINNELRDARLLLTNQEKTKELAEREADPVIEEITTDEVGSAPEAKKVTEKKEAPKKKGFVSVNIEESESEEEEEKPRETVTVKTIESKFPLKTQREIDEHAKLAKELMKKGADDFKVKLAEADRQRAEKLKAAKEPAQKDFE